MKRDTGNMFIAYRKRLHILTLTYTLDRTEWIYTLKYCRNILNKYSIEILLKQTQVSDLRDFRLISAKSRKHHFFIFTKPILFLAQNNAEMLILAFITLRVLQSYRILVKENYS